MTMPGDTNYTGEEHDEFPDILDRIEPDLEDIRQGTTEVSIAISLKRIADSLEHIEGLMAREAVRTHG